MAKQLFNDLAALCEALGVEDPNTVTRVVVDIRGGHVPMLYVERIGDAQKIVAALSEPGIELRREAPPVLHARGGANWQSNRCAAEGGLATNDDEATCPACRAVIDARREHVQRPVQGVPGRPEHNGPTVHGNVSGNIAWGNGSVVQNGR